MREYTPGSWMRVSLMPSEVHKKVTGKIKATKEEIIEYVLKKYPTNIYFDKKKYWVHQIHGETPVTLEGYTKGQFEHIADAIVMAEIGLERIDK
jgi:YbbR domain-containing protein